MWTGLSPRDLIWPYVVGNYLEGRQPDAFDILYWNADSTNTYLENNLRIPATRRYLTSSPQ